MGFMGVRGPEESTYKAFEVKDGDGRPRQKEFFFDQSLVADSHVLGHHCVSQGDQDSE